MVFRYLVKKPNDISGQVTMAHSFLLSISTYQYLVGVIPVVIIAFFTPTPYVIGGLVGAILILAVHAIWIQKHKSQMETSNKADASDGK